MRREAAWSADRPLPTDLPPSPTAGCTRLHATCVEVRGQGVLLLGRPGTGKSDLALRLIDQGACLVADDQIEVTRAGGRLIGQAPQSLRGLIEVRGFGIVRLPVRRTCPLALVVRLDRSGRIPRLPEAEAVFRLLDLDLPCLRIDPRAASAPAVIRVVLGAERVG